MHDNEDPILTAIHEEAEKLEWHDRKDLWNRSGVVRIVETLKSFVRRVAGMFT